jgi:PPP family 3-phenylpropionic acid transporter
LFAIFLSFLPVYLSEKGIPKTDIGMILGAGGVIGIFSQPFWGIVCDRKKTIKKVLMAIIGISIGLGVLLFQSSATLPLVVLVGLMYFFFMPSDPLIESLNYQSAQRYRVHYGSIRMYGAMGYATASIIIGTVTNHFGITSMAYLFLGYGIITFMTCITLDDVQANQKPLRFHDLKRFLSQKTTLVFFFMVLIIAIPHRINDTYIGIYIS